MGYYSAVLPVRTRQSTGTRGVLGGAPAGYSEGTRRVLGWFSGDTHGDTRGTQAADSRVDRDARSFLPSRGRETRIAARAHALAHTRTRTHTPAHTHARAHFGPLSVSLSLRRWRYVFARARARGVSVPACLCARACASAPAIRHFRARARGCSDSARVGRTSSCVRAAASLALLWRDGELRYL